MEEDKKKWSLTLGLTEKEDNIEAKVKIKDQLDENSALKLELSKDKIYAEYELKF